MCPGRGRRGARSSLGVPGRRVSPSPRGLTGPCLLPSPRRKPPPGAGPRGPDPYLQHEVLPLRAQDAPCPPGQRHQVRSRRPEPHRRAGCSKSGASCSHFRGAPCAPSSEAKSVNGQPRAGSVAGGPEPPSFLRSRVCA